MIDAKHVHKLLECKYDFKHWIKDVISSFNFKDGIDYISYRYDNNDVTTDVAITTLLSDFIKKGG